MVAGCSMTFLVPTKGTRAIAGRFNSECCQVLRFEAVNIALAQRAGEQRHLHGHGVKVVGHSFRSLLQGKPFGQLRVLGCDTHGALAGVAMVTLPGGHAHFIDEIRLGNIRLA